MTNDAVQKESGLSRRLSSGQQAMMALGGAIGTGLFLASGLAVNVAGPAVIVSYVIGAGIALLLGAALAEMAVAHPTAGSFGLYAGMYVSPFAGYAVRMSYWLMQAIATGGQLVAVSVYMSYWFPGVPDAIWIVGFSAALVYVNAREVGTLGEFEYWFSMIKVVALVAFIVLGVGVLFGWIGQNTPGLVNYRAGDGFFARGAIGVWMGVAFVIYSYIGVEAVATTSGEAIDPGRTIPVAMRRMVFTLASVYVVTVTLLVGLLPHASAGVSESPFVTVLRTVGLPGAAGIMNFVVLSAALSAANANVYVMTRALFSLARAGFVPAALGRVSAHGSPLPALLVSSAGLAVAMVVRTLWPDSAYVWFFGVALFGGVSVWLMIFVTHLAFRREWKRRGRSLPFELRFAGVSSAAGATLLAAVLATTWWIPDLRITLLAGGPWVLILWIGYMVSRRDTAAGR